MSDLRPTVSVIIPVRDGAAFLAAAIQSALTQSVGPVEILVVDDGSQDDTREVAERFLPDIRYAWQPPRGIAAARNRGVEISNGGLLTFLDADDLFEPRRLDRQVSALDGDPALDAVFGRVTEFVDPTVSESVRAALRPPRDSFPSHMVWAMMIRRSAFERVGPFATDFAMEAVEWYSRALDAGLRSTMLDAVVLRRRLHGANVGLRRKAARGDYVRVARAALDRRRSGSER